MERVPAEAAEWEADAIEVSAPNCFRVLRAGGRLQQHFILFPSRGFLRVDLLRLASKGSIRLFDLSLIHI